MKNVIVFALGGSRFAVELRWVREVITLGFVTPVPSAPGAIGGVVNLRGSVTPVVDLFATLGTEKMPDVVLKPPRKGDGALLVDVDGLVAAIRVSNVETVSTLQEAAEPNTLVNIDGKPVPLIDVPELLKTAQNLVTSGAARALDEGTDDV